MSGDTCLIHVGSAARQGAKHMTLEQLRVFVAVAGRQHVTRAAAVLNLAQSAISAAIAALEERHGANVRAAWQGATAALRATKPESSCHQVYPTVIDVPFDDRPHSMYRAHPTGISCDRAIDRARRQACIVHCDYISCKQVRPPAICERGWEDARETPWERLRGSLWTNVRSRPASHISWMRMRWWTAWRAFKLSIRRGRVPSAVSSGATDEQAYCAMCLA